MTMNSGAIWFDKSDVVSKNFRVEAKTRTKPSKSITIQKEWLDKIENEAFLTDKTPTLAFSFGDGKDYFILSDRDFYEIAEKFNEEDKDERD